MIGQTVLKFFISGGFSWFQLIPGFGHDSHLGETLHLSNPHDIIYIPAAWTMVILVLGFAGMARMGLEQAKRRAGLEKYLPDTEISFRNLGEILTESLYNMTKGLIGEKETRNFFPLVASFFTYIFFSNIMAFIPGFSPVTGNFSSNFALGFLSFLVFNYAGLSRDPVGYLKHLAGPIAALMPLFFVLETFSLCIRPISLTFRLTVNIFVDHLLQEVAREIGYGFFGVLGQILLPLPLYFLGLLVCFMQAFVFALLSGIYVSMALPHDHGDHDPHDKHHNNHH